MDSLYVFQYDSVIPIIISDSYSPKLVDIKYKLKISY